MNPDAIVVGLGAMGSAALYQLSQTGKRVLGIDQFDPPHTMGSSHGDTRVTREAIGEGEVYVPLVQRSHAIWRELEDASGLDLYHACGGLFYGTGEEGAACHGVTDFIGATASAAKKYGIDHEMLDVESMRRRFPQFMFTDSDIGYYEPTAGYLRPERCIATQLKAAAVSGASVRTNEKVLSIEPNGGNSGGVVTTVSGRYEAETVIVTAGAWIREILPKRFDDVIKVYRQILYWFDAPKGSGLRSRDCPVYIRLGSEEEGEFYGFPEAPNTQPGIKMAQENFEIDCNADDVNRDVSDEEIKDATEYFTKFIDIKPECLASKVCMYTATPDCGFIIDRLPDHPQIIVASPCSGHGFKHSAGIGVVLNELAMGLDPYIDISPFSLKRFS